MAHLQLAKIIQGTKFEVFDYATHPGNMPEQLAGVIEVKWQNPGVHVQAGAEFLFLMSRFGVEQPVRFIVEKVIAGNSLTYRQMSGVFARLTHTMKFEEHGQGDTLITDLVEYELPFGLLGRIADDFIIRRDLKFIFEKRLERMQSHFRELKEAKKPAESQSVGATT